MDDNYALAYRPAVVLPQDRQILPAKLRAWNRHFCLQSTPRTYRFCFWTPWGGHILPAKHPQDIQILLSHPQGQAHSAGKAPPGHTDFAFEPPGTGTFCLQSTPRTYRFCSNFQFQFS